MSRFHHIAAITLPLALLNCGPASNAFSKAVSTETPSQEEPKPAPDNRPFTLAYLDINTPDGLAIIIDNETGCQYIHYVTYKNGAAMVPRMTAMGTQLCTPKKRPAKP